jgi:hypothetical protein
MKKAYVLTVVIFAISLISMFFIITLLIVNFYLFKANKNIKLVSEYQSFYKVFDEIKTQFENDISDNYTSSYDGWFSNLKKEIDGYKVDYIPEDCKLDVNHIDLTEIGDNSYFRKNKVLNKYLYYPEEIEPYLKIEVIKKYKDLFTIYSVPNLNISKVEKIKLFMESQMIPEDKIKSIIEKINSYRGGKSYLGEKGLIINENAYITIRNLYPENDYNTFYSLFDYKGTINLNFVNKDVFELSMKLCGDKKADVSGLWQTIENKHDAGVSIKSIKEIFSKDEDLYQKIFSTESKLFKVIITKDKNQLIAIIRIYNDFREKKHIKIFKIMFAEIKPVLINDASEDKSL